VKCLRRQGPALATGPKNARNLTPREKKKTKNGKETGTQGRRRWRLGGGWETEAPSNVTHSPPTTGMPQKKKKGGG